MSIENKRAQRKKNDSPAELGLDLSVINNVSTAMPTVGGFG